MTRISANVVSTLGRMPVVGNFLRWYARRYEEGSVVRIARGHAAGLQWKRYHRYVNGYWVGVYEMQIQQALVRELKDGDTFYDIGANAGFFSLLGARLVGAAGRVFAFEPLPENMESLQEQFSINSMKQCQLIPKAVGNCAGSAALVLAHNNSVARIADAEEVAAKNLLTVETITLDEFVKEHTPPDFIKMDVEGFETEVLTGASKLLASTHAPKLLIELHGDDKARQVEATLSACGYRLTDLAGSFLVNGAVGQSHIMAYPPKAPPEAAINGHA